MFVRLKVRLSGVDSLRCSAEMKEAAKLRGASEAQHGADASAGATGRVAVSTSLMLRLWYILINQCVVRSSDKVNKALSGTGWLRADPLPGLFCRHTELAKATPHVESNRRQHEANRLFVTRR